MQEVIIEWRKQKLRDAIDRGDIKAIQRFNIDHPEIFDAVSPNGYSALWWALLRSEPNFRVAQVLADLKTEQGAGTESGQKPTISLNQRYAGLPVSKAIDVQGNQAALAEQLYITLSVREDKKTGLLGFVRHGQNTHNSITEEGAKESVARLYDRYGHLLDSEEKAQGLLARVREEIEAVIPIHLQGNFKIGHARDCLERTCGLPDQPIYSLPSGGTVKLTAAQILCLVWIAMHDLSDEVLPDTVVQAVRMIEESNKSLEEKARCIAQLKRSDNDVRDSEAFLLQGFVELRTADVHVQGQACWWGTHNKIVGALNKQHVDVSLMVEGDSEQAAEVDGAASKPSTPKEILTAQVVAEAGRRLMAMGQSDEAQKREQFWAIWRFMADETGDVDDSAMDAFVKVLQREVDVYEAGKECWIQGLFEDGFSRDEINEAVTYLKDIPPNASAYPAEFDGLSSLIRVLTNLGVQDIDTISADAYAGKYGSLSETRATLEAIFEDCYYDEFIAAISGRTGKKNILVQAILLIPKADLQAGFLHDLSASELKHLMQHPATSLSVATIVDDMEPAIIALQRDKVEIDGEPVFIPLQKLFGFFGERLVKRLEKNEDYEFLSAWYASLSPGYQAWLGYELFVAELLLGDDVSAQKSRDLCAVFALQMGCAQGFVFDGGDFENADLRGVALEGVDLSGVSSMEGADLNLVSISRTTRLKSGYKYHPFLRELAIARDNIELLLRFYELSEDQKGFYQDVLSSGKITLIQLLTKFIADQLPEFHVKTYPCLLFGELDSEAQVEVEEGSELIELIEVSEEPAYEVAEESQVEEESEVTEEIDYEHEAEVFVDISADLEDFDEVFVLARQLADDDIMRELVVRMVELDLDQSQLPDMSNTRLFYLVVASNAAVIEQYLSSYYTNTTNNRLIVTVMQKLSDYVSLGEGLPTTEAIRAFVFSHWQDYTSVEVARAALKLAADYNVSDSRAANIMTFMRSIGCADELLPGFLDYAYKTCDVDAIQWIASCYPPSAFYAQEKNSEEFTMLRRSLGHSQRFKAIHASWLSQESWRELIVRKAKSICFPWLKAGSKWLVATLHLFFHMVFNVLLLGTLRQLARLISASLGLLSSIPLRTRVLGLSLVVFSIASVAAVTLSVLFATGVLSASSLMLVTFSGPGAIAAGVVLLTVPLFAMIFYFPANLREAFVETSSFHACFLHTLFDNSEEQILPVKLVKLVFFWLCVLLLPCSFVICCLNPMPELLTERNIVEVFGRRSIVLLLSFVSSLAVVGAVAAVLPVLYFAGAFMLPGFGPVGIVLLGVSILALQPLVTKVFNPVIDVLFAAPAYCVDLVRENIVGKYGVVHSAKNITGEHFGRFFADLADESEIGGDISSESEISFV